MQIVTPDFKGKNPGHYSAGVISNGMLYVSGQLSLDPDTREPCTGDIRAHALLALNNVDRVLKAAGVTRNQVVLCRVYTPSSEYWGAINEVYAEFSENTSPHALSFPPQAFTSAASLKSKPWLKCIPKSQGERT